MWVWNKGLLIYLGYGPIVIAFGAGQHGLTKGLNEEEAVMVVLFDNLFTIVYNSKNYEIS